MSRTDVADRAGWPVGFHDLGARWRRAGKPAAEISPAIGCGSPEPGSILFDPATTD